MEQSGKSSTDYQAKSWWTEQSNSLAIKAATKLLRLNGPLPQHVAFVMDGNRRFAKTRKMGSVLRGHEKGFEQLQKVLSWCRDLDVREVTVYAFSIENFKRSTEEVEGLMHLAEEQFRKLLEEEQKLNEEQVCFRFWGKLELLRPSLRKLLVEIERKTKDFNRSTINICMPYTAKDEMVRAAEILHGAVKEGVIEKYDVNMSLLQRCMDSRRSTDPDLLIRTSGEKRWSDFLLVQGSFSHVYFTDVLWPEFEHSDLCKAIYDYQSNYAAIRSLPRSNKMAQDVDEDKKIIDYIENYHIARFERLEV